MADSIPWAQFEQKYARLFKGKNGKVAKPLRMALGSLIIQTKYQFSDRELVEQLTENPYYQYFIGLPGYQEDPPIDASTLVLFRKRLKSDVIMEANEYLLAATKAKKSEMYEYAIKEIVGHKIQDITESTYTIRDLEWLRKDMEKIK